MIIFAQSAFLKAAEEQNIFEAQILAYLLVGLPELCPQLWGEDRAEQDWRMYQHRFPGVSTMWLLGSLWEPASSPMLAPTTGLCFELSVQKDPKLFGAARCHLLSFEIMQNIGVHSLQSKSHLGLLRKGLTWRSLKPMEILLLFQ